ncbi:MAG: hypothetical protein ACPG45_07945 [Flavobacteriaceae bacterium]
MLDYNQIISDYIRIDNTAVKNVIIDLFVDSDYNSLPNFLENVVSKCGVTAMNIMLVHGDKWDVYMNFSADNVFSEKQGILELVQKPVTRLEAENILANKVIHLLDTVDFHSFKMRL